MATSKEIYIPYEDYSTKALSIERIFLMLMILDTYLKSCGKERVHFQIHWTEHLL